MASGLDHHDVRNDIHTILLNQVSMKKDMESMNEKLATLSSLDRRVQGLEDHNTKADALDGIYKKMIWASLTLGLLNMGVDVGALKTWVSTHFLSR